MKLIIDIPKITYEATKDLGRLAICNDNEIAEWIIKGVPLEQEPFIDKPCVSSKVCEHDKQKVLDKITEIIEPLRHLSIDEMSGIEWDILRVIDKYKAESEK